jgi:hypothetical protein
MLNRGKNVVIRDRYRLEEARENLQIVLMSWRKPVMIEEGLIKLENPEMLQDLEPIVVRYGKKKFEANVETITLKDARLRSSWGEKLFRIVLRAKQKLLEDDFVIEIGR